MIADSLLARRYRVLGHHSPLLYEKPLHLVRGSGVWLFDSEGKRYLDAYNNVPHVGHCHPHVVEAICRQVATLNTHTRYLHENIVEYAERLTRTFDPPLSTAVFCCSGSEANELALRIARHCTGGEGVIATDFAYHGNTAAVIDISSAFTPPERRSRFVKAFRMFDSYREYDGRDAAILARLAAARVKQQIEAFAAEGIKLAALLVCTAFANEGLPNVPQGFMAEAARHVHEAGGLLIADEVQGGFGRFGTHMWGHQLLGVRPDIVTLGKPMGNGHPLAGVVSSAALIDGFEAHSMYFNTFGGTPVSCAAGLAVLDVLAKEGLLENARIVGEYMTNGLRKLQAKHEAIGDVRGKGLFVAVELVENRQSKAPAAAHARRVINSMRERGVLISRTGCGDNILKIRPPMPFSEENADQLLGTLDESLSLL